MKQQCKIQKIQTNNDLPEPSHQEPNQEPVKAQFADNKLFTADKVAAARARLKSKMGNLNSGLDPELYLLL